MKVRFLLFLLTFLALSEAVSQNLVVGPGPNPPEGFYEEAHRFVFFAVLEGCYSDGLIEEDLDWILARDDQGNAQPFDNFILSCPLCGPAMDAFEWYAERPLLSKQIIKRSRFRTFGSGLAEEVKAELAKGGEPLRNALQALVGKWIEERVGKLRLTTEEEAALRDEFALMRKKGEAALERFQSAEAGDFLYERYKDWKFCPTCSGVSPMAVGVEE